jgi:hypothetical protein
MRALHNPPQDSVDLAAESGFGLVELLVSMLMLMLVVGATVSMLVSTGNAQLRDATYGQEVTATQTALARMVHDLREATQVLFVTPSKIEFQMPPASGVTETVLYDCTASDTLGSAYTRCARTQSTGGTPPVAGSKPGPDDIQHIYNNAAHGYSTFCKSDGSAPSGAVFYITNSNIANTDGSTAACDEAYEDELGSIVDGPEYVQVQVEVPASNGLTRVGTTHYTVLDSGVFLPNLSAGA